MLASLPQALAPSRPFIPHSPSVTASRDSSLPEGAFYLADALPIRIKSSCSKISGLPMVAPTADIRQFSGASRQNSLFRNFFNFFLKNLLHFRKSYDIITRPSKNGPLVKRLRRRPLTA